MSPDLAFWLALIAKMLITAAFTVAASMVAERAGPLIGSLVATLPIASGPAYVFLALEHTDAFIAASSLGSLAVNVSTGLLSLAYVVVAQRAGLLPSLTAALATWFGAALAVRHIQWNLADAIALNVVAFAAFLSLAQRFMHARLPPVERRWYDVPLRAILVAGLVTTVVGSSSRVGPAVTGVLAVFPVVLVSLMLILHPRIGGPATATLIANTLWGVTGFSMALLVLHVAVVPLGAPAALGLALVMAVGWNLSVWTIRRRLALAARARTSPPAA